MTCEICGKVCKTAFALASHSKTHPNDLETKQDRGIILAGRLSVHCDAEKAVVIRDGREIRTYFMETHGERFRDLAAEYANKLDSKN